jgi:hypothetical protein
MAATVFKPESFFMVIPPDPVTVDWSERGDGWFKMVGKINLTAR